SGRSEMSPRMSALEANRTRRDGGNDVNDPSRKSSLWTLLCDGGDVHRAEISHADTLWCVSIDFQQLNPDLHGWLRPGSWRTGAASSDSADCRRSCWSCAGSHDA